MQIIWSNATRCLEATLKERRGLITEVYDIQYPDWLDDNTQPVNEWRDRALKEIQSLKRTGRMTTQQGTGQTGPGAVPVSSGGASGLLAEGTQLSAIQVAVNVQQEVGQALASLQTPLTQSSATRPQ